MDNSRDSKFDRISLARGRRSLPLRRPPRLAEAVRLYDEAFLRWQLEPTSENARKRLDALIEVADARARP